MKRNLITATLVILTCSSVFLLFSCTKKQVLTVEKETKAPPTEVANFEKETTVAKEQQEEESKEAERVRTATLEELEGEVQAALEVGGVHHVHDQGRPLSGDRLPFAVQVSRRVQRTEMKSAPQAMPSPQLPSSLQVPCPASSPRTKD